MKIKKGFSLFEVIIYIAIVAVVFTTVLGIVARSISNRIKAESIYTVTHGTRFALERMVQTVRAGTDIDEADFSSNILTVTLADGTILSYQVVADQLVLSTNGGAAVTLTPSTSRVTEFTLTDRTTVGTAVEALEITLALEQNAANPRPEYLADFSLTTTAMLRLWNLYNNPVVMPH